MVSSCRRTAPGGAPVLWLLDADVSGSRATSRLTVLLTSVSLGVVTVAAPAAAQVPDPTSVVTEAIGGGAGWAFGGVADGIEKWVLGAVEFFVQGVLDFLRTSSGPNVESSWFAGTGSPYAAVRNIAALLLVGFVFLAVLHGLVHGDPGAMLRRILGALPVAVGGTVVTTTVVGQLLKLTDALSDAVLAGTDQQAIKFLSGFGAGAVTATGGFAVTLLGLVAVLAALLLWVELMVRTSLVYLLVAISPIGFAALVWPAARGLLRRIIEVLLAVILSKFVISVALAIGVAALAGAGRAAQPASAAAVSAGASTGTLLAGAVVLALAAFSPFLVLKLVPFAEAALVAQGVSRAPARSAQTAMSTYSRAQTMSRVSGTDRFAASSARGAASARASSGGTPTGDGSASKSAARTNAGAGSADSAAGAAAVVGAARAGARKVKASADVSGRAAAETTTSDGQRRSVPNGDR